MTVRILQVTPVYFPELQFGGPPQKIHAVSRALARNRHDVRVATLHSTRPRANESVVHDGIPVQYIPWARLSSRQIPLNILRLHDMVREADIIHAYGLYDLLCPTAAYFARRLGRPFVLEPLGMYHPRARNVTAKKFYHRLFTQQMARISAAIVAGSKSEAEELRDLARPDQLVVRRNGIDLATFEHLPDRQTARLKLRIAPQERIVLFLGRVSPIKNLEVLIEAFENAGLTAARLILAGPAMEAEYTARLRALIAELGLEQRIIWSGAVYDADKLDLLSAADLFVLPSLSESYGNVAAEAVASGVPVLLTHGCGIAPQIDGRAGLAVAPTVEALANGLRLLLDDPHQRALLTARRAEVLQGLSWDEPLRITEALYERLVYGDRPKIPAIP